MSAEWKTLDALQLLDYWPADLLEDRIGWLLQMIQW